MKNFLRIVALLLMLSTGAAAQTLDCITKQCQLLSDAFPASPAIQPTACNLYDMGSNLLDTKPVVGPADAVFCSFIRNFPAGSYSLTATAIYPTGESGPSNIVSLVSQGVSPPPPPAPTNPQLIAN